jgi:O-antigen ligase
MPMNNRQNFLVVLALFGYGIVALLIKDPLASRLITIPFRFIVLSLGILTIWDSLPLLRQKKWDFSPFIVRISLIFFIVAYSTRLIYDTLNSNTLQLDAFEYLVSWFGIAMIPGFAFIFLKGNGESTLRIAWLCLNAISLMALQNISLDNQLIKDHGRLGTELLNPISLGIYGGSLLVLSLYIFLSQSWTNTFRQQAIKAAVLFSSLLGIYLVFASGSKGPTFSTLSALFAVIMSQSNKNSRVKLGLTLIGIALFAFIASSLIANTELVTNSSFFDRFASFFNGDGYDATDSAGRGGVYQMAIELFLKNPLLGFGLEVPGIGYAHNLILDAFLSTGIIGGLSFTIVFFYSLFKCFSMIVNANNSWKWLCFLYIEYAVIGMFSGGLYRGDVFWYLLFAIIGYDQKMTTKIRLN